MESTDVYLSSGTAAAATGYFHVTPHQVAVKRFPFFTSSARESGFLSSLSKPTRDCWIRKAFHHHNISADSEGGRERGGRSGSGMGRHDQPGGAGGAGEKETGTRNGGKHVILDTGWNSVRATETCRLGPYHQSDGCGATLNHR